MTDDQTARVAASMRAQLLRLMMSALDFRHALSAATFLLEDCDWSQKYRTSDLRRLRCYETTMVVAYGRPFAESRGHGAPFAWKHIKPGFELEPHEAVLHEKLMECRNKLHAHSDGDFTKIVPQIWRTEIDPGSIFDFLAILGGENLVFGEDEIAAIHTFLWKIRHHVDRAIQDHPAPRDGIPIVITDVFNPED